MAFAGIAICSHAKGDALAERDWSTVRCDSRRSRSVTDSVRCFEYPKNRSGYAVGVFQKWLIRVSCRFVSKAWLNNDPPHITGREAVVERGTNPGCRLP